jgi:tyrosyl-tRNA synthetase
MWLDNRWARIGAPSDKGVMKVAETAVNQEKESIPQDILDEAKELIRGAEVLPDGVHGLAQKIYEARKEGRKLRVKFGVDPTSSDLHLGHAVVFRKLRRFQELGHQVVLIIGGFTAQIGDPSGRDKTRPALTREKVEEFAQTYVNQLGLILNVEKTEVTNNADWLSPLNFTDVLKLASFATVNQMLAKEAFGERMEKQLPIAMHELFYPMLQAYDSVAIKADIELGGNDQRFNILQGRELQPKYGLSPQLGMFLPILEGTDGVQKMSKSYNNYIALNDEPTEMFGKCMRIPDSLILRYFELTTTLTGAEIDKIDADMKAGANPKVMKEMLGHQIVKQYHGEEKANHALEEWKRVHSEKQVPDDIEEHAVSAPTMLFRILVDTKMVASGGEAKRLIAEGAVRVDGEQVRDANLSLPANAGESVVIQIGRRKFIKVKM